MDNTSLTVPLAQRVQMLFAFPCFQILTQQQNNEFAALWQEVRCPKNTKIVNEGDLVDAIFIIIEGDAEVSISQEYKKKRSEVPIAVLSPGEAIGLNDSGFYSETGYRTASVTALTEMLLLKLTLPELNAYLKSQNLEYSMYKASKQMLLMQFIKQSLPFAKISNARLRWLVEQVTELSITAGTELFKSGDEGDKSFFIHKGKIEIYLENEGQTKQLAVLKPPVLFGEATFISGAARNASARAIEDCELLVLDHVHLAKVVEAETSVATMFMTLSIDRSMPNRLGNVSVHERFNADGQEITILKNIENGKYFKLSKEGAFIWQQMDGNHTLQEITLDLAAKHNVFAPDLVASLIAKLAKNGFTENIEIFQQSNLATQPLWAKTFNRLRRILEIRYAFGDANKIITYTYNKMIWLLFTKLAQVCLAIFAVLGLIAFVVNTADVLIYFASNHLSLFLLFALIPFSMLETLFHELGHAYAVKACGREVHYIGVGWYWFTPIAFTDTSDMWLASRRARMYVNVAGVYVDVIIAGASAFGIYFLSNPYWQCLCWLFAMYTYIGAIRMLSPLQEMDGYYILMDWVEKNRLRQSAVLWLVKGLPKCIREPRLFKYNLAEVAYWTACFIYLSVITLITYLLQHVIFDIFEIPSNPYLAFMLPFIVVLFSCFGVLAEIKNRAEE